MQIEDIKPDMRVTWAYAPPGGNEVTYVFAQVRRVGARRVTIVAPLAGGGTRTVRVSPARLSPGG